MFTKLRPSLYGKHVENLIKQVSHLCHVAYKKTEDMTGHHLYLTYPPVLPVNSPLDVTLLAALEIEKQIHFFEKL
jgi:hypothetical protein